MFDSVSCRPSWFWIQHVHCFGPVDCYCQEMQSMAKTLGGRLTGIERVSERGPIYWACCTVVHLKYSWSWTKPCTLSQIRKQNPHRTKQDLSKSLKYFGCQMMSRLFVWPKATRECHLLLTPIHCCTLRNPWTVTEPRLAIGWIQVKVRHIWICYWYSRALARPSQHIPAWSPL